MRILLPTVVIAALIGCGKGMLALNDTGAPLDTADVGPNDTGTSDTTDTHDTTDTTDTGCPDSDNDGVCNSSDRCPGSDDRVDSDSDGVPNGCDDCPNDRLNDGDGDGICDSSDPCPGDPSNSCGTGVTLTIQADNYPSEISWELWLDSDYYYPTDNGYFTSNYQTYTQSYDIPAGTGGCVFVDDSYGDGGSTGQVVNSDTNAILTSWSALDYGYSGYYCFSL